MSERVYDYCRLLKRLTSILIYRYSSDSDFKNGSKNILTTINHCHQDYGYFDISKIKNKLKI